ncbi:PREDICTED: uncharacterized protein LOC109483295 [Branchiostoma belcheri]|uniref:Uncharacterized protein LOC109483295 n=1 Tax=Branchiostoma belcheri TaxID=7741 RepID=A0A6P5AF11_BRABE|nr:PREDICTED: uncharacterized protein LOC109483295 [Branchiostoma belcheri]
MSSKTTITASSESGTVVHAPTNARLNFKEVPGSLAGAWLAGENNVNQWLMFDLGQRSTVGVIRTQGRQSPTANDWVTSYSVSYGNSSGDDMWYKDANGDTIVFTGNSDRDSLVTHVLTDYSGPVHARYVKFHPVTWYGWIGMRADIGEVAPVGFWPLNRHTQLRDVSGYGNDATGVGVSLGNGVHGESEGAYNLSGSSTSYIEIPNNGALDTRYSITILAYVYPTGTDGPIVNYRINDNSFNLWHFNGNELYIGMWTRDHASSVQLSAATLNQNEWNFVGVTYSYPLGRVKLWHDGIEVGSLAVGTFETGTHYDIRMGFRDGADPRAFQGRIACLQIYNIPLNGDQIRQAAAKCRVTQPVGLWRLTKQYGLTDTSGNGNDATGEAVALGSGVFGEHEGSYVFSGSSTSYIEIPNDRTLDTRYSLTILASVYPTGQSGPLLHYGDSASGVHMWQDSTYFLQTRLFSRNASTNQTTRAQCLKTNQWNFVGITYNYNSGILKIWYEGLQIISTDIGVYQLGTNHAVRIGAVGADSYSGSVCCVQIYDVALNESEIEHAATRCKVAQPVGLWRLTKQYGLTDTSGNGNDATGENVTLGNGAYGELEGSYVFSGSSTSYIEIPNDRTLDTRYSLTILASVYPTGQSGPLLQYGDSTSGVHMWQDSTYFLNARLFSRNAVRNQTTRARCLKPNQWNSVGLTYDYNSGILKLWYEGLEISSADIRVYQLGTNHAVRIGAVGAESFNGSASCVKIYDVALTQSQIEHAATLCTDNSIALGKPTTQSSDYDDSSFASRAVDGYTGPINQCTHTQLDFEPWWKLDLGGSYVIGRVRLLNRRNEYGERLEEFQVRVGEDSDISKNSICGRTTNQLDDPPEDRSIIVDCAQPITGRYVSVQLINRTDYLTLCEVDVFVAQVMN